MRLGGIYLGELAAGSCFSREPYHIGKRGKKMSMNVGAFLSLDRVAESILQKIYLFVRHKILLERATEFFL